MENKRDNKEKLVIKGVMSGENNITDYSILWLRAVIIMTCS